jgi:hypothetical protein
MTMLERDDEKMTLQESIDKALNDVASKEFLHNHIGTIRENIVESERRISKNSARVLSLITISELINRQIISEASHRMDQ